MCMCYTYLYFQKPHRFHLTTSILIDRKLLLLLVTSVVSDSVQPHRRQPTRLPRPWDSSGKNTGVGCHFLLQSVFSTSPLLLPRWFSRKESASNADVGDSGSIPGSGRSPGGGNGNPLQDSCQEIPWTEEPDGLQSVGSQNVRQD